jgi:ATP-binding cassette subfamily B protein
MIRLVSFWKDLRRAMLLLWEAGRSMAAISFILQLVQAALPVVSLYFIKKLIELLTAGNQPLEEILRTIIYFSVIQLMIALFSQWSGFINSIHQQRLSDHLSRKVLEKAVEVDYEYYENPVYHDTLHLAQVQSIYKMPQLLSGVNSIVLNLFTLAGVVIFFFTISSSFALLFALFSIPLAVIKWYYGFELYRLERRFAPMEREANYLHRTLTDVAYAKESRVFGFGKAFIRKFRTIRRTIHEQKSAVHRRLTIYSMTAEAVEVIAMSLILGFLAKETWEKLLTIGAFVVYIQGLQRLQGASRNFMQALVQVFQLRQFLRDLFAFFDIAGSRLTLGTDSFPSAGSGLEINNLSFTYPNGSRQVLDGINLHCKPGKIIAIVGENGSGKSTLVKLLANLYPVQSGAIRIGGRKTTDIEQSEFRKNTLFLFQDFEKYFFTVEENIALGEPELKPPERLEQSATLSGAWSFISGLPKGFQTRMGTVFNGSAQLSGGQWQKLVLSRIFYKDARLVILDEPTSALDAHAEAELFRNVKVKLADKMMVLVSHRLYNLKIADYIYMMKNGRIVQEGAFEELVAQEGEFREMYRAQKL